MNFGQIPAVLAAMLICLPVGSPALGETPGPREMGCFAENPNADPLGTVDRDLDGAAFKDPAMTVNRCVNLCTEQGFRYAGVQNGSWCFCGDTYGRYKSGPAACTTKCAGDASQVCGGEQANTVYDLTGAQTGQAPPQEPSTPRVVPPPAPAPHREASPAPDNVYRVVRPMAVGKWPEGIASDGRHLWIAESGQRRLARLDPATGRILQRVKVGRLPVGLAATSDGRIYAAVATDRNIWEQAGRQGRRFAKLRDYPHAIRGNDEALWVLTWVGGSSGQTRVVRIDLNTRQRTLSGIWPDGFDLTLAGGRVWVLLRHGGANGYELVMLDKGTLQEVSRTSFDGFTTFLAASEHGVFAAGGEFRKNGLIVRFDAQSGTETARRQLAGFVSSIATYDDKVIAVDHLGVIWIFSAHDLSPIRTIRLDIGPYEPRQVLPSERNLFITTHRGTGGNGLVLVVEDWQR